MQVSLPQKAAMLKVLTVWLLNSNLRVASCAINKNCILIGGLVVCLLPIASTSSKWDVFNL